MISDNKTYFNIFIDRPYFLDYNEFIEEGKKMKCPFCGEADSKVIDSRPAEDGNSIRRRRQCNACKKRFTTYEKIETIPLIVIKKDNNRPISADQINKLVDEIETEIFNREEREIPAQDIGEIVMNRLKELDAVAYVRFASVYREFKDVNTFMDEIQKILK